MRLSIIVKPSLNKVRKRGKLLEGRLDSIVGSLRGNCGRLKPLEHKSRASTGPSFDEGKQLESARVSLGHEIRKELI
jgi:hypothetical protein